MRCRERLAYGLASIAVAVATIISVNGCSTPAPSRDGSGPDTHFPFDESNDDPEIKTANTGGELGESPPVGNHDTSDTPAAGLVSVDRTLLDFSVNIDEQSLRVRSEQAYTVTADAAWVSFERKAGADSEHGDELVVRVDRRQLAGGQHAATLTIRVGAEAALHVTLRVLVEGAGAGGSNPVLEVLGGPYDFKSAGASDSFLVRNGGGGELQYTVSPGADWIQVSQTEGLSRGEYDAIRIYVRREGLQPGEYEAGVTVTGAGSEQTVDVGMSVDANNENQERPQLYVSHSEFDFGPTQTRRAFLVRNTGGGTLRYAIQGNVEWAALSSAGGANDGLYDTIAVTVDRAALKGGVHRGRLQVLADNGQQHEISLKLSVPLGDDPEDGGDDPAVLELSVTILDFGRNASIAEFSIRNAGGGSMNYSILPQDAWISTSPNGGESSSEWDRILVSVQRDELPDGQHVGVLTVVTEEGLKDEVWIMVEQDADPNDMDSLPYFGIYMNPAVAEQYLNDDTRDILLRPFIANLYASLNQAPGFRRWYYEQIPGAQIGRYFSAIYVTPLDPPGHHPILLPDVPDEWLLRDKNGKVVEVWISAKGFHRKVVDLRIPEVRQAQIEFWMSYSQGWTHLFVDNVIYKISNIYDDIEGGPETWWAAYRQLFAEYRERNHLPLIINVATKPIEYWRELFPFTDGIMTESALSGIYHLLDHRREYYITGDLAVYRAALDAGKTVLLANAASWAHIEDDEAYSLPDVAGPLLSAVVCLVKNPGDRIYFSTDRTVSGVFDYQRKEYHDWWQKLGRPLGRYTYENMAFHRDFANGSVHLDISTPRPSLSVTFKSN